jgi:hypothetical protein
MRPKDLGKQAASEVRQSKVRPSKDFGQGGTRRAPRFDAKPNIGRPAEIARENGWKIDLGSPFFRSKNRGEAKSIPSSPPTEPAAASGFFDAVDSLLGHLLTNISAVARFRKETHEMRQGSQATRYERSNLEIRRGRRIYVKRDFRDCGALAH